MKFCSWLLLVILLFTACSPGRGNGTAQPGVNPILATAVAGTNQAIASATRTVPPPPIGITRPPSAESAAKAFLEAWKAENYPAMYEMLTGISQDALDAEKFSRRFIDVANRMTLKTLDYEIRSALTNPSSAQVAYRVTFHTKMLGDMTRDNITMNLSLEKGSWRVQWDDGLIMPELKGGNNLALDLKSPTRGNLYDRNGAPVAAANDIFALGIVKTDMDGDQESRLLTELSRLTGKPPEWIKALYDNDTTYLGDYVAVGEVPRDWVMERYDVLAGLTSAGLRMTDYSGRYYFQDGIAPHVTGFVQAIFAEELDKYLREGYRQDDLVGKAGLEKWGEGYLLGQRGAALYVTDPSGTPITRLAQVDSKPSQSIYTTIDSKLQVEAQKAMNGFSGAIVVLERDTGRVLALVSSPGFDPNAFVPGNFNTYQLTTNYASDGRNRLYNRASGNGYPLGSVFKIITTAAALESGLFVDETLNCQYEWTEIPGLTLDDWTKEKEVDPSGVLTLPEGLMRSCNPWFYHIGYQLYKQGKGKAVSDMARAFGLGSSTGVDGLDFDEAGNIPDPVDDQSSALIAIGQDKVLVNPLQVARFVAAVGNGGTLYRPQVVEKITDPDGNPSFQFKPEAQGTLPVKPENLEIIQEAMRWVVSSPRGTAVRAFSGLNVIVHGKTGTAQNDYPGYPHAWFAGYTNNGRADKPDIAFAVIAEYAGEGSDIAAPIARRILEVYFLGQPQRVYPWESRINVTRTPTPSEADTPVPPSIDNPAPADTPVPSDNGFGGDFNVRTATPSP